MLGRNKRPSSSISTLVGAGTKVTGNIEFSGGLHIDGNVNGDIKAVGKKSSVLSISERGSVEGVVTAPHVLLNGKVKGDVYALERLELGAKARVDGNVQYKLIGIEVGAEVNGKLVRTSADGGAVARTAQENPDSGRAEADKAEPRKDARQQNPRVPKINVVGE